MSTRVGNVEVGHGTMAVLLQIVNQTSRAVVLSPARAEELGILLIRQASFARLALEDEGKAS